MKPFDIELAKQGHPVQTRDGRPVRIICFDRKNEVFPIVALVVYNTDSSSEPTELINTFTVDGKLYNNDSSNVDLFMVTVKKEGWLNLYRNKENGNIEAGLVYDSEEEAILHIAYKDPSYVTTKKIEWEE